MLKVPPVKQRFEYDCGPACVDMVLRHKGIEAPYDKILRRTKCTSDRGTGGAELAKFLTEMGLPYKFKTYASIDHLRHLVADLEYPVIVGWFSPAPGSHWSVVTSVGKERISLLDPSLEPVARNRYMTVDAFQTVWFSIDATGEQEDIRRNYREFVTFRGAVEPQL